MADSYDLGNDELWKSKIVKHTEENPEDLLANPLNFRIHSKLQQDATAGLLSSIGWVKSVQVNINTQTIVDGHERVTLAMRKPGQKVPVEWVDLTEEEEAIALMALDHIVGLAGVDVDKLGELSTAVDIDGLDFDVRDLLNSMIDELIPLNGRTGDMDLSKFSGVQGTSVLYRVVVDNLDLSEAESLSGTLTGSRVEQYRL